MPANTKRYPPSMKIKKASPKLCDFCEYSCLTQTTFPRRKCILGHRLVPLFIADPYNEKAGKNVCKDYKYSTRKNDWGYLYERC